MVKLFGGRVASAIVGLSALAMGSSATAQDYSKLSVRAAIRSVDVDASAQSLGTTLARPAIAATTAVATATGSVVQAQPAKSVTVSLTPTVASQAAWLFKAGWGLDSLVDKFATDAALDEQTNCLATAVYYEARGETDEGQLAVARVIMNRAASGKYPSDWCGVITQPWQFSFVNPHTGALPQPDVSSTSWRKAEAVAMLAAARVVPTVGDDVLWYHANYVAPSWGHRLQLAERIGAHIFYRA